MYLFPHLLLHQIEVVLQHPQLAVRGVQLINQLVALFGHLGVDHLVNVLHELLALSLVVGRLSFPDVDEVQESLFLHGGGLADGPHGGLGVLDEAATEGLEAVVEVPHGEDHAGAGSEGFDLGAAVLKTGEELLDEGNFGDDVEVGVLVYRVKKSACELLLGVDKGVNLGLGDT